MVRGLNCSVTELTVEEQPRLIVQRAEPSPNQSASMSTVQYSCVLEHSWTKDGDGLSLRQSIFPEPIVLLF